MNDLRPFSIQAFDVKNALEYYDIVLCTLGFEARARYLAGHLRLTGRTKLVLGFESRQELDFGENAKWFNAAGFESKIVSDDIYREVIGECFLDSGLPSEGEEIRVCIDISSLNRFRLASVVMCLLTSMRKEAFRVHFVYNIARFAGPTKDILGSNEVAGIVSSEFAGWAPKSDLPPIAVVGLGYEEGKALGAVEFLQADEFWAFDPYSPVEEYRAALADANELLLRNCPPSRLVPYRVDDPVHLFRRLESLIFAIKANGRPIILPFGPKIFTLVGLLVACLHREASVWRVSSGQYAIASNRYPSDFSVGLELGIPALRV